MYFQKTSRATDRLNAIINIDPIIQVLVEFVVAVVVAAVVVVKAEAVVTVEI